jgi:hypothetical protein
MRLEHSRALRPSRGQSLLLAATALLILTVALAACGGSGGTGGTVTHPTGKADVVLRIETGGGFVTVEYNLTQLPSLTIYGDGTVLVTGPMIEIYPQPAMPNLQQATISQDDIDKILAAAKKAGLFANGVDYGQPSITDVGTTTITINADGQTYTSDIYALGIEEVLKGGTSYGLTAPQAEARTAVSQFTIETGDLDTFLGTTLAWAPYEFSSLSVFSRANDPANPAYDTSGVQPNRLDWPLGDIATTGEAVQPDGYRRVVVTGSDLTQLEPLLDQATQITLWKSADREYYLYFRPLLPDENAK